VQTLVGEDELFCVNHPKTATALRCSKCLDPICLKCAVRTPVGMRCPKCTGAERGRDGTYFVPSLLTQVSGGQIAKAPGVGLLLGVLGGIAWGQWRTIGGFGDWSFWFALIIGLAVGEAVGRAANERRGPQLQAIAALGVFLAGAIALLWSAMIGFEIPFNQL